MRTKTIVAILTSAFIIMHFPSCLFAQEIGGQEEQKGEISPFFSFLSETGRIIPDIETNSILVIDFPANVDKIEKYLKMVDVPVEQVLIETRIVEVKLEKEHSLGINWSLFTTKGGAEVGQFRLGSAAGEALTQNIPFRRPKWEPLTGSEQEPFSVGIFDDNIDIVLKALATQLKTNLLSAPKITTVNNRRAKINVIKSIPYLKEIKEEEKETAGGSTTTKYTYEYEYTDEGVTLEVTPLINPDRSITMLLYPEVKEIVKWHEMARPALATGVPTLPETDIRTAYTKVTVREGQTLVIGGLIREKMTKGETKIPLLGDIPFIGSFFRSEKETKKKTELLILVSPTIITPTVIFDMENEEKTGIGKWYTTEQKEKAELPEDVQGVKIKREVFSASNQKQIINLKKQLAERNQEIKQKEQEIQKLNQTIDRLVRETNEIISHFQE